MSFNDIYRITQNRTLMIFIFSSILAIVTTIYWTITNNIVETNDRITLLEDSQFIKSQLNDVKNQIIEELSKPDNVTLYNPSNVTLVIPNASGEIIEDGSGKIAGIGNGPIIIDK